MFFPLLLLVCSVSTAELQVQSDNDILSHVRQTEGKVEEAESLTEQQTCTQDINAVLREMTALVAALKVEVQHLQKDNEAKQLAFSASLLASGQEYTGPFNTDITLIFRNVVTNIGNAYNPNTGLFIAPVRGVYHFDFHIYGGGSTTNPTSAVLVKNGEQICVSWTRQPAGGQKASNGVSLLLEIGDVVFLRMRANSRIYDNTDHHTTFSGHLLFTM
uniref:Cerebellin 10 n=1 Tax=Xiphophorus maculatus TaxID=8083 RepID=A0A3B5RBD0_XIPMA